MAVTNHPRPPFLNHLASAQEHLHTGSEPAPQTARLTAIDEALAMSDEASHNLLTRALELQDRLRPVLMPEREAKNQGQAKAPTDIFCGPPMALRIGSTTERMVSAINVLADIADRLEV